ncbi:unnamed protein product [Protopolystoma xenopodis]|uniref:Uncharacterized protein n=1 Tax=Protopolystoma xenopodis TaxID=117903 RepID=A0A448WCT0_9PLAT|nr:unnamed protein product [Protopolystoma xenopodis]
MANWVILWISQLKIPTFSAERKIKQSLWMEMPPFIGSAFKHYSTMAAGCRYLYLPVSSSGVAIANDRDSRVLWQRGLPVILLLCRQCPMAASRVATCQAQTS